MGKNARPVRRPVVNDRFLCNGQIRVSPAEIAEQLFHLTTSSKVGDDELASARWECDGGDTRWNKEGIEVWPAEDRLEDFAFGEEDPSGVEDDPNAST